MKKSFKEFYKNKKVLVTGASGFVGSWLVATLIELETDLYGIGLDPLSSISIHKNLKLKNNYKYQNCDITNLIKIKKTITKIKPQILFHLASQAIVNEGYLNPINNHKTNINGLINILDTIKNIKNYNPNIIVITSDKVYENNEKKIFEENDKLGGEDPYSASKSIQEIISSSYAKSFKLNIVTARAGNIIGGGDWSKDRLMTDLILFLYQKKKLIIRNLYSIRPWQYIGDVVNGYLKLAIYNQSKKVAFESFNFSMHHNNEFTVNDIIELVEEFYKKKINFNIKGKFKEKKILLIDSSKARKKLNWKYQTSFEDMLNRTLSWYDCYYKDGNEKAKIKLFNEVRNIIS